MNFKISLYILLIAFTLLVIAMILCANKSVNMSALFAGITCAVCCMGLCFSLKNY